MTARFFSRIMMNEDFSKSVQPPARNLLLMIKKQNALIIAGTHSGCGKTTVSLGIMAALTQREVKVQPFKCGPDFIDPTRHLLVSGNASRNLDVRMCGPDYVRHLFTAHAPANDIPPEGELIRAVSVIEGVMGLFDGGRGSAAELASLLGLPVILVVDVRSAAESTAAVVKGFECLDPQVRVTGVIFNQVSATRHLRMVGDALRRYYDAEIIGSLPRENKISLPSRHLGLHMGTEVELNRSRLIELVEEHIDLDLLLHKARSAQVPEWLSLDTSVLIKPEDSCRLGVAWDEAFCFYYQDNLDMLRDAGAELVLFSPLYDKALPEHLDGLYLGGGYPELHAAGLAANRAMREQILAFSRSYKPVYAECGGFMYLTEAVISTDGQEYPLAAVYPTVSRMGTQLRRLGYRQVKMQTDTLLGSKGGSCYGHEFHYSEIDAMPDAVKRGYVLDDGRTEGYVIDNTLAGYIHLHWGRSPEAVYRFVRAMQESKKHQ